MRAIIPAIALTVFLSAVGAPPSAVAQSGSAGGSIGNDEKSLSGSRSDRSAEPAPSARRSKPAEEPRSSSRRGGGGVSFDGAWMVVSVGCGGTTSGAVVVSSGKVIGQGVTGTVSASGAVSTFGQGDGVTFTGSGRLAARSGSGSFRRSDGCGGTWTSTKQ
ncbi:hypothetical protein IVB56_07665 [Bradyrhizobium sp. CW7]|uniref:hypothetical protein n=1 Tax=Bradyrhizobium sp. CW7 TaxID=2782688 RepID=UPI001FF8264B|nr:hypothetical protein [Bradyrhizobium sp. CW7]MCK1350988.1 hypothetical protein [Bradyrhizobium sp. CW7]